MVAGHLQEKKGLFYIVLNFVDSDGKRKRKWIATGLPVKGNKRKAEAMLVAERQKYQPAEYQRTADAMSEQNKIQLFENQPIRTAWNEEQEEWYFSVVDVIHVLTGSENPRRYWSDLKRKLKSEGATQLYENSLRCSWSYRGCGR